MHSCAIPVKLFFSICWVSVHVVLLMLGGRTSLVNAREHSVLSGNYCNSSIRVASIDEIKLQPWLSLSRIYETNKQILHISDYTLMNSLSIVLPRNCADKQYMELSDCLPGWCDVSVSVVHQLLETAWDIISILYLNWIRILSFYICLC